MNKRHSKKLKAKYPNVYRIFFTEVDKSQGGFYGCQAWGFECGDGWYKIIDELSAKIENEISKLPKEEAEQTYAVQVKEKYGTLRFYMSRTSDTIEEFISEAEHQTSTACERCGEPGETDDGAWVRVRCKSCEEIETNQRKEALDKSLGRG